MAKTGSHCGASLPQELETESAYDSIHEDDEDLDCLLVI